MPSILFTSFAHLVYRLAFAIRGLMVRCLVAAPPRPADAPWNDSVSFKNHSSQLPWNPMSVSSFRAPRWYARGQCANCARSISAKMMVSSRRVRIPLILSRSSGSPPSVKLNKGVVIVVQDKGGERGSSVRMREGSL